MAAENHQGDPARQAREAAFHDHWAADTAVDEVQVRAAFEAPTAFENRFIMSRLGDVRGKRVLDVGTGLGEAAVYFALHGAQVTATDLAPAMVDAAGRLAARHGVTITGLVCPAEALTVPADSCDVVYLANVLHHVADRAAVFREVRRVLKPGGRFYAWEPLAYNPVINIYRRLATQVRTADEQPLRRADVRLARELFVNTGHREFWLATLVLFVKYYAWDRVHPNADRYWKRVLRETPRALWWWWPLRWADVVLTRLPGLRWWCWNVVMWGEKPQSAPDCR